MSAEFDIDEIADWTFAEHGGLREGAGRTPTHRKNITIYIKEAIIAKCGPNPGTTLRKWIEGNWSALARDEQTARITELEEEVRQLRAKLTIANKRRRGSQDLSSDHVKTITKMLGKS
jgi:hypothetical protein